MTQIGTVPTVVGRGSQRAISWAGTLAVIAFLVGAWQVGIWVNHWYLAEKFAHEEFDASWTVADLLRSGNEALVNGSAGSVQPPRSPSSPAPWSAEHVAGPSGSDRPR